MERAECFKDRGERPRPWPTYRQPKRGCAGTVHESAGQPEESGSDRAGNDQPVGVNSFVMPINPADPSHQADTSVIGDALNLAVLASDDSYLPITAETATIYLVLGRDNAPYTQ